MKRKLDHININTPFLKLTMETYRKELNEIGCDSTTKKLLQNMFNLYNAQLQKHLDGDEKAIYLIQQIGGNINNTILNLKKLAAKKASEEPSGESPLESLISKINNQKTETRN